MYIEGEPILEVTMKALSEKYQTGEFWNIWKFLDQNVNDKEPALNDGDKWESYYSNLFQEDETNPNDNMTLISFNKINKRILNNQNLNQIITYKEVKKIISKIKKRKAAGLDRILNEMLKSLKPTLIVVKLLNLIMSTNIIPMKWYQGLISPIFNSDELNPENYRPICVTSCLS